VELSRLFEEEAAFVLGALVAAFIEVNGCAIGGPADSIFIFKFAIPSLCGG
jgi:hypothetical protein